MLMFNDDFAAEFGMPPLAQGRMPFFLNLYVPDADATWAQAIAAGCEVTMPIGDQFWGDRYGHLRDPFEVNWAIAARWKPYARRAAGARREGIRRGHP